MKAMNCEQKTPQEMQQLIAAETADQLYTPSKDGATVPVTLHFNLLTEALGEMFFTIYSHKTNQFVYRGPFTRKITIQANHELLKDKGGDNFKFVFFKIKSNEICVAEQDAGELFWQPNANVHIDFLPYRELDEKLGLPISYKVRIE